MVNENSTACATVSTQYQHWTNRLLQEREDARVSSQNQLCVDRRTLSCWLFLKLPGIHQPGVILLKSAMQNSLTLTTVISTITFILCTVIIAPGRHMILCSLQQLSYNIKIFWWLDADVCDILCFIIIIIIIVIVEKNNAFLSAS